MPGRATGHRPSYRCHAAARNNCWPASQTRMQPATKHVGNRPPGGKHGRGRSANTTTRPPGPGGAP
eukprot:2007493-Lingulodinium_polyedra.AAC.1